MLVLKPVKTKKMLMLGNYITMHVSGVDTDQAYLGTSREMRLKREGFFRRIEKERPELKGIRRSNVTMINKGNRRREVLPNTLLQRKAG